MCICELIISNFCVGNVLVEISNIMCWGAGIATITSMFFACVLVYQPIWGKRIFREHFYNTLSYQTSEEVRIHKMLLAQNMLVAMLSVCLCR